MQTIHTLQKLRDTHNPSLPHHHNRDSHAPHTHVHETRNITKFLFIPLHHGATRCPWVPVAAPSSRDPPVSHARCCGTRARWRPSAAHHQPSHTRHTCSRKVRKRRQRVTLWESRGENATIKTHRDSILISSHANFVMLTSRSRTQRCSGLTPPSTYELFTGRYMYELNREHG